MIILGFSSDHLIISPLFFVSICMLMFHFSAPYILIALLRRIEVGLGVFECFVWLGWMRDLSIYRFSHFGHVLYSFHD